MAGAGRPDIARSWRLLLLEEEALKHYPHIYLLHGTGTHRDQLLDSSLPSLLYIKAVAILDDGLAELLARRGLVLPKTYKDSLAGRIDFLSHKGLVQKAQELHRIRDRRNALAHESGEAATWDELAKDRDIMHENLLAHALVKPRPRLEFHAERSGMRATATPGYLFERDYEYGVREDGKPALEVKWKEFIE